jgi:hypothetical protein
MVASSTLTATSAVANPSSSLSGTLGDTDASSTGSSSTSVVASLAAASSAATPPADDEFPVGIVVGAGVGGVFVTLLVVLVVFLVCRTRSRKASSDPVAIVRNDVGPSDTMMTTVNVKSEYAQLPSTTGSDYSDLSELTPKVLPLPYSHIPTMSATMATMASARSNSTSAYSNLPASPPRPAAHYEHGQI